MRDGKWKTLLSALFWRSMLALAVLFLLWIAVWLGVDLFFSTGWRV